MAAVTRKRGAKNSFIWGLSGEEFSKLNIPSQSKAQCWFRKRKTELKIIEKTKICIPAMLKPYSASSCCLPNKNRVGVAHGDGTNLEVVYRRLTGCTCHHGQHPRGFCLVGKKKTRCAASVLREYRFSSFRWLPQCICSVFRFDNQHWAVLLARKN